MELRDRIESRAAQRMTRRQTSKRESGSTKSPMDSQRFDGIDRTRRLEPTGATQKWGQKELVAPDKRDQQLRCHCFDSPIRLNIDSKSLATSIAAAFAAPAFARMTRSMGDDGRFCVRKASRISRLALFLTTAPPTFRLATIPSRLSEPGAGDAMMVR